MNLRSSARSLSTIGRNWHTWPSDYRRPDAPAVAQFAAAHANRVRLHQWVQWLLDEQLAQAATELALMQDLPIGIDPDGADAWAWQDVLAINATVGVPPDQYNTKGQNWGMPPFVPHKLRAAGHEPFRQTIRANLRHARGLRIDHGHGPLPALLDSSGCRSLARRFCAVPCAMSCSPLSHLKATEPRP